MALNNCRICDKQYNYCPHCKRYESWKAYACSPEHYQIHLIIDELNEGIINKLEAKTKFNNIGINENYNFDEFLPEITEVIKAIILFEEKPKKTTRKKAAKLESIDIRKKE